MLRTGLLLLLFLSACTPVQWVRQDTSAEQFSQDAAQCQRDAWREAQFRSFLYRPFGPVLLHDGRGRPFFWSHSPFGDPFGDRFMEESRLTHFCLRAKGYDLVPVEPKKAP